MWEIVNESAAADLTVAIARTFVPSAILRDALNLISLEELTGEVHYDYDSRALIVPPNMNNDSLFSALMEEGNVIGLQGGTLSAQAIRPR